jgi:hypothetical protein
MGKPCEIFPDPWFVLLDSLVEDDDDGEAPEGDADWIKLQPPRVGGVCSLEQGA